MTAVKTTTKDRPIARKGNILAFESDAPMARRLYDTWARLADPTWRSLRLSEQIRWMLVAARIRQMGA